MTKNLFISALAMLLSISFLPLLAQTGDNAIVKEVRKVSGFTSIRMEGVGSIVFTQSSNYNFQIEGPAANIKKYAVSVEGKELVITQENEQNKKNNKQKVTFYISAPDLSKVVIEGVGNFSAPNTLSLKNLVFKLEGVGNFSTKDLKCDVFQADLEGVGNMDLRVDCQRIKVNLEGVGNMTLSGRADKVHTVKEGTGKIDIKNLTYRELNNKE